MSVPRVRKWPHRMGNSVVQLALKRSTQRQTCREVPEKRRLPRGSSHELHIPHPQLLGYLAKALDSATALPSVRCYPGLAERTHGCRRPLPCLAAPHRVLVVTSMPAAEPREVSVVAVRDADAQPASSGADCSHGKKMIRDCPACAHKAAMQEAMARQARSPPRAVPRQNFLLAKTNLRAIEMRAQAELHEVTKDRMTELQKANSVLLSEIGKVREEAEFTLSEVKAEAETEICSLRDALADVQSQRDAEHDGRLTAQEGLRRLEADLAETRSAGKRLDLENRSLREELEGVKLRAVEVSKREAALQGKLEEARATLARLEATGQTDRQVLREALARAEQASEKLKSLRSELKEERARREALDAALAQKGSCLAAATQRAVEAEAREAAAAARLQDAEAQNVILTAHLAEAVASEEATRMALHAALERQDEADREATARRDATAALESELEAARAAGQAAREEAQAARAEAGVARAEAAREREERQREREATTTAQAEARAARDELARALADLAAARAERASVEAAQRSQAEASEALRSEVQACRAALARAERERDAADRARVEAEAGVRELERIAEEASRAVDGQDARRAEAERARADAERAVEAGRARESAAARRIAELEGQLQAKKTSLARYKHENRLLLERVSSTMTRGPQEGDVGPAHTLIDKYLLAAAAARPAAVRPSHKAEGPAQEAGERQWADRCAVRGLSSFGRARALARMVDACHDDDVSSVLTAEL